MIAAYLAGEQDTEFTCSGGGYAAPGANVIFDDAGPAEVHGRIGIDHAYEVSCNQYFAQMGVSSGRNVSNARRNCWASVLTTRPPKRCVAQRPEFWNGSTPPSNAPGATQRRRSPGKQVTRYDLALIGYGQGYAGQMTPFQMALAAATIGNLEGKLMKPKIEFNLAPQVFNQVVPARLLRACARSWASSLVVRAALRAACLRQ